MFNFSFAYPYVLLLLILIPILILWHYRIWIFKKLRSKKSPSVVFSNANLLKDKKNNLRERFYNIPLFFRLLALALLIIALARPQSYSSGEEVYTEGIDIVIVLDISGSMLAQDFRPDRLVAAKQITKNFINGRLTDRIGLVIFSRDAFTQCPLTIDYNVLINLLNEIKSGMIEDGTAIGNAIANAVNRIKDSKSKSKVMILLTDGVNNAGEVDPITAAEIAKSFDIRIYTIGVGTYGQAPYPFQTPFGIRYQMVPVEIDESSLKKISQITDGKYFRATDNKSLEKIYNEIDKMEKTKVETVSYKSTKEHFPPFVFSGFILILLEVILSKSILRKLP
ncbi:MAG: VWA domain-containing protein [Ignavibacterium sp.]